MFAGVFTPARVELAVARPQAARAGAGTFWRTSFQSFVKLGVQPTSGGPSRFAASLGLITRR